MKNISSAESSHAKSPPPNLYRSASFLATHKSQIIVALSIFVFIVALFLRIGFAYQKGGFHIDETASIAVSTGSWIPKLENGEFFGKELKEKVYFDDNSISDLRNDLKELWKNNYGDGAAHPNLYYTLLRAWSLDIKSGDFAWIKSRGIGLNLVFFTLGFYAIFILMTKIFSRHSLFVPLFLAFAFWNSASVTNTIFVRPYALQEMLLIIFTLNCFIFYNLRFTSTEDAFKTHTLFFVWFSFATALLCLSHYFSLFFIAFAFIFLAILSRKNIFPLSVVVAFSFIFVQLFYKDYFAFLNGYRAKEAQEKMLLGDFTTNLNQTFSAGVDIITTHFCNIYGFGTLLVASFIAMYFIWRCDSAHESAQISKSNAIFLLGFFIIGVVAFCLFLFVSPFKVLRYVMPIFPFLYFGVLLLLSLIKKPLLQGILGIAFVASLFINYNVKYLYKTPFIFTQNPKIPVLVHFPKYNHLSYYNFVFAFYDTQIYIIESNLNLLQDKVKTLETFYLISDERLNVPLGYKQIAFQAYINTDILANREEGYVYEFKKIK